MELDWIPNSSLYDFSAVPMVWKPVYSNSVKPEAILKGFCPALYFNQKSLPKINHWVKMSLSTKNNSLWHFNFNYKKKDWADYTGRGIKQVAFHFECKNLYAPECLLHSNLNILTFIIRLWNLFTFEYYNMLLVLVLFLGFLGWVFLSNVASMAE